MGIAIYFFLQKMSALIVCNCENLYSAERDGPILQSVARVLGFSVVKTRYIRPKGKHSPEELITSVSQFQQLAHEFVQEVNQTGRGFLSLSSHGYSGLPCMDGSDRDGKDEYIKVLGTVVRDGDLRNWFLEPLREGVSIFIIVDTCHSGTMFDLPWYLNRTGQMEMENKLSLSSEIYCFSACDDRQSAMDDIGERGYSGGLVAAVSDWILANPPEEHDSMPSLVKQMYPYLKNRMKALGQDLYLSFSDPGFWQGIQKRQDSTGCYSASWVLIPVVIIVFISLVWMFRRQK
jgi:hypothetical protein